LSRRVYALGYIITNRFFDKKNRKYWLDNIPNAYIIVRHWNLIRNKITPIFGFRRFSSKTKYILWVCYLWIFWPNMKLWSIICKQLDEYKEENTNLKTRILKKCWHQENEVHFSNFDKIAIFIDTLKWYQYHQNSIKEELNFINIEMRIGV